MPIAKCVIKIYYVASTKSSKAHTFLCVMRVYGQSHCYSIKMRWKKITQEKCLRTRKLSKKPSNRDVFFLSRQFPFKDYRRNHIKMKPLLFLSLSLDPFSSGQFTYFANEYAEYKEKQHWTPKMRVNVSEATQRNTPKLFLLSRLAHCSLSTLSAASH